jgi:hypothetical protein
MLWSTHDEDVVHNRTECVLVEISQDGNVFCSSPTSPCRYGAVAFLPLQVPASLLVWLRLSGALVLGSEGISRVTGLQREARSTCWMGPSYLYIGLDICMYQSTIPCGLLIYSLLHGQPRNWHAYNYTEKLPGPKCCFGAGKKLPQRKLAIPLPRLQIAPKSSDSSWRNIWKLRHAGPNVSFCSDWLLILRMFCFPRS